MTMSAQVARVRTGVALVLAAVACFAALDTATKLIALSVPALMLIWFRYSFQALLTLGVLLPRQGTRLFLTRHPGLQLLRGVLLVFSSLITFFSLKHLPVGEFTAVVMLTPLLITVVASLAMGQGRVSALRWALLLGGLIGALLVIRPGGELFQPASLLPLLMMGAMTAFQLLTSRLAQLEPIGTTHFYTGLFGAVVGSVALPWVWQTPDSATTWWVLLLVCVFSSLGHLFLILAYDRAPAVELTPFLYFQIGFAMLGGWWMFDHMPDLLAWLGMAVIAVCGVLGTWFSARENRRRQQPVASGDSVAETWAEVAP